MENATVIASLSALVLSITNTVVGLFKDRDKLTYDKDLAILKTKVEECENDRAELRKDVDRLKVSVGPA
ncbi:hypothetical protein [Limnoglobus roseus]|uniref:Uncharacterized protein n=1 Tax=Limnoglobus roseus TaxID=2598579 RepID=A0A5C1AJZ5_9BACT|nr:hypothetical protein [Limnoglobus roseus]QEL18523.1 hypothetical protein PX52LOC_05550 [Limnoglobus roseus]